MKLNDNQSVGPLPDVSGPKGMAEHSFLEDADALDEVSTRSVDVLIQCPIDLHRNRKRDRGLWINGWLTTALRILSDCCCGTRHKSFQTTCTIRYWRLLEKALPTTRSRKRHWWVTVRNPSIWHKNLRMVIMYLWN